MPRRNVTISHPNREYFPRGFRKIDLIRYYSAVAEWMLPHLKNRPVTLIRFPEGVRGERFYEKNAPRHAPAWIKTFPVPRRRHEGVINYILVNNVETLAWCANLGAIKLHPFLHRAPRINRPTHLAFDLDPGEGADLLTCIEVAGLLRDVFGDLGRARPRGEAARPRRAVLLARPGSLSRAEARRPVRDGAGAEAEVAGGVHGAGAPGGGRRREGGGRGK